MARAARELTKERLPMRNRWIARILGGAAALLLNASIALAIVHTGLLAGHAFAAHHDDCTDIDPNTYACCYPGQPNNCTCCVRGQSCCYDSANKTVWCKKGDCGN